MEYLILLICLAIFGETSFLILRKYRPLNNGQQKIYVDTSVLIDGRILNIAKTGFLNGNLVILKSVLKELQLLADNKDSEKRIRARAGLEVALELERIINVDTEIIDDGEDRKKVDDELLKYAKETRGAILTLDYNLIKVAEAEKIKTLNINDLALAVRTDFLPGEKAKIKITEKGANRGQGIGHLPNGTMVVIDKAAKKVGEEYLWNLPRFTKPLLAKLFLLKSVDNKF